MRRAISEEHRLVGMMSTTASAATCAPHPQRGHARLLHDLGLKGVALREHSSELEPYRQSA